MTAAALTAGRVALGHCAHCGAESAAAFCCAGCAAAHDLVDRLGLDRYYRLRTVEGGPIQIAPPPLGLGDLARIDADGTASLALGIQGLRCGACVWLIEAALKRQPGVLRARLAPVSGRLDLVWRTTETDIDRLARTIATLGYSVGPWDALALDRDGAARDKDLLLAMAVAGFAAANVMLLSVGIWAGHAQDMDAPTRDLLHWLSALIALPALAFAARPFFRSAWSALRVGRTNMDVPISLALILAPTVSLIETVQGGPHAYFDSAITLAFFLLVGRYLDSRARSRARSAVAMLGALEGRIASILEPGGAARVRRIEQVRPGMVALVAPGSRMPVDGTVVEGRGEVDASPLTGEAQPVKVAPGGVVHAGSMNLTAPLRVRVDAVGDGTLIAEMARLMAAVEGNKSRYVASADRVARFYAPLVHTLALSTLLGSKFLAGASWADSLLAAVAVLIVTCPCALALAVPVAVVAAGRRLLMRGILVKSPTGLERLAEIDTVVFDKTGTLTRGALALVGAPDSGALRIAASLAANSRHPLARALVAAAPEVAPADGVMEVPGFGLQRGAVRLGSRDFCGVAEGGEAGPELWLARPGHAPLRFAFADQLRSDAVATIGRLRDAGYAVALLSGDRAATVADVAAELGIERWQAACAPIGKVAALRALRAAGHRVLMVGDGINDAAALAAADASLAPASGADVTRVAADATFQGERLDAVAELLLTARATRRVVRQNLALAIAYNLAAVPLAMAGWLTPLIAAAAMSSSSLLVIANATRLSRQ